ncbi:ABC transporter permease [Cecembia sp.]|uniref:ABC transporter permease n=1 Tax=Cecembia sp. TaxID=1898110 RepID=UPI0025B7FFA1|nr:ABC transporter permease [Cecembia sp.]
MDKVWLVIKREYLSRVQKKSFLLATLLTPLIFPAIMGFFLWIALDDVDRPYLSIIEVVDENNFFFIESSEQYAFSFSNTSFEDAKRMVREGERFGLIYIPTLDISNPKGITYYSNSTPSMGLTSFIEGSLKRRIEEQKLYEAGIDPDILDAYRTKVNLQTVTLDFSGEEKIADATVNYALGFLAGIMIYIFIFIYGNQIMQGVIEEKSSRIIEILVSSIRPFQLMLGKIIGIGAVGLTQFLIWIILIGTLSTFVIGYLGLQMPQQQLMEMGSAELNQQLPTNSSLYQAIQVIQNINFFQLILTFIFYFLGGYLLYGALFAAIGAAIDAPSEAQQFMLPITIPLLIAYLGLFIFVLDDPNSKASFWLSIIPFTSPIAMMGRASYGIPFSDLLLSMSLLVIGFIFSTWIAGKIYRIGILIHGTKINYKTIWKWLKSA